MSEAAEHLSAVQAQLTKAAKDTDRAPRSVNLIAVSKTFDADAIRPVLDAGQRVFGENRVQESAGKWPALREQYAGIELHLIGPLQSNKTQEAVALFDVIHTVDRPKIAKALAAEMGRTDRHLPVFIQVNTGAEAQKAGVLPEDIDDFLKLCRDELKLDVKGLMCIPPVEDEPAVHFGFLATLAKRNGLEGLSMGMSSDFKTAIQFGATHVRVGSAIFGARTKPVGG